MKGSHTEAMQRVVEVDILRGIGIFSVLLIHSTVLYTSNKVAYFLWDTNQFAVQLLVFCSAYIYFLREKKDVAFSLVAFSLVSFLKKRIIRLLQPYYLFMIVFFGILFLFERSKLTSRFITESITLSGGIDINWLVLLMVQFAVAFPIVGYLKNKFKTGFYLLGILSIISAILLLFIKVPFHYKQIMWLPWLSIIFYSLLFVRFQKNIKFLFITFFLSLFGFISLYILQTQLGHSHKMFDNKYPPNLYFLMYGAVSIPFFLLLNALKVFDAKPIKEALFFLSSNSFTLYFIHYIVIYFLLKLSINKSVPWYMFFTIVMVMSVLIQIVFNRIFSSVKPKAARA